MLIIRLREIPADGADRRFELTPSWFAKTMEEVDGEWTEASGELPVRVTRHGAEVLVRGEVTARFRLPCARCLEPAPLEVHGEFATTFIPAGSQEAGDVGEDPDLATYQGDEIDLSPVVREQLLLGIPISPLCSPECLGICPQCGTELNRGACSCAPSQDPRWEALRKISTSQ